ncbi:MAG: hypothetical protein ACTSU5_21735, partial [Promethearchaeota archaeon]
MIVLVMGAYGAFFLATYEQVDEHEYYTYDPPVHPQTLNISVNPTSTKCLFRFTDDPAAPVVQFDVYKRYNQLRFYGKEYHVDYQFDASSVTFNISYTGESWDLGYDSTTVFVWLRKDVLFNIEAHSTSGWLEVRPSLWGTIGNVSLSTDTGTALMFNWNATMDGTLSLSTQRGCVICNGENARFNGEINVVNQEGESELVFRNATVGGNL